MRQITDHKISPVNEPLKITATDELGPELAYHRYEITGYNSLINPSFDGRDTVLKMPILFQHGDPAEVGVNGITHEALLAILAHRMRMIQKGPAASRENALALTKIDEALHWLGHAAKISVPAT